MPDFVAVDGEADRQGRYILLCDSLGRVLHRSGGIGSREAFEWLTELGGVKNRVVVCFGLNYDVNQWLADLGEHELRRLSGPDQKTTWRLRWKLGWWPSKYFTIRDHKTHRTVKVCEVFGFFQTSFVNALKTWGLTPPAEIEAMKQRRGTFTAGELDRIVAYCQAECGLLVELMNRLARACRDAGCEPAGGNWIGAGSIASSLLRGHGVKEHHAYDRDLATREHVEQYVLGAYFGGRVELLTQGVFPVVHTRDIRSAYPHAATQLPSLTGAKTQHRKRYCPELPFAIWNVRWQEQAHGQLAPFPVRQADGSIVYPQSGQGHYHAVEVLNAINLGYQIEIVDGLALNVRSAAVRPFDWIPGVYRHRARLKAAGDAAEKALKLGLNSVYGKLAQGYGHGQGPPFQNYWWAGHITATTRSRLLALAHRSTGLAMISTDGLFSTRPGNKGSSRPSLGSWEPDTYTDLFCAQPGVYHGQRGDTEIVKSRGFFAREISYPDLQAIWQDEGAHGVYHYTSRRFLGLRVCLHRNRMDLWRRWVDEPRSISLQPARKQLGPATPFGALELLPPNVFVESQPYTPKQSLYDDPQDRDLENMIHDDQPHYEGAA